MGWDRKPIQGLRALAKHFSVREDPGMPLRGQWRYYYLYGLERVARFLGLRHIGDHDWYRLGVEELVTTQSPLFGSWTGVAIEQESVIATSLAVLFLATGRLPVLVNKLSHGPGYDWNNDPDDIRNLVGLISADWKHRLGWQIVDAGRAGIAGLLQAPIAYMNGHEAPILDDAARSNLRDYLDQGGFLFAEA